jgi:hypothetical protein
MAIKKQELIIVYGDFDADGVTSTALLMQTLTALGANVKPYIPHRVDEGYGLNSNALVKLAQAGAKLIITVDCGIRSVEDVEEGKPSGSSRLVIMAPVGAEVYVDDERKGSIGSSGRVVLRDVPAGQHILRVSKTGERDDERVIEIREAAGEQVIQAQLRTIRQQGSQPTPSQGSGSSAIHSSLMPGIVACTTCQSRFAEGVQFCGRCGGRSFALVSAGESANMFPCPRCAAPLPENSRFCGRCGLNMGPKPSSSGSSGSARSLPPQAERVCKRCGGAYPAHIRFCGRCGGSMT